MFLAWRRLFALCLFSSLPACGSSVTSTTTLEVKDPSRVALLRGDQVVLPAGNAPTETDLGEADVEPVPGGHSQVNVAAVRAPTGAISFKWDTRLPLATGEEQTMLPAAAGKWTAVALHEPVDVERSTFRWDVCASLRSTGWLGYQAVVELRRCGAGDLDGTPLAITTPWSNVVVTRRTTVVPRARPTLQLVAAGFASPLLILAGGGDLGSAGIYILEGIGVSVGVAGVLLGVSLLFPAESTCTEVLGPASAMASNRTAAVSSRACSAGREKVAGAKARL
jgi:hypothetical protein